MTAPPVLDVDLTGHDLYRGGFPHELFRELRDEHPVWRHPHTKLKRAPEGMEFWVVLGHPELQALARDWRTFSSLDGASISPTGDEQRGHTLVSADPPNHSRMRKLISSGFTPRMIKRLDEQIAARTTLVLDAAAEADRCNFVQDVAYQLPMHVIADILGIPEADRPDVFAWTDTIMSAPDPEAGISSDDWFLAGAQLYEYARELGEDKRRRPTDDVWSILTTAEVEGEDGEVWRLTASELDQFFLILTIAGSETTRSAISGALVAFRDRPDQWDLVRKDPSVLGTAVEEILRFTSPVACFARTATEAIELGGQQIEAGDRVSMWFPAANRDPRVFERPDEFDITREHNPQVSFGGGGAHFCLGAHLARNEIRTMIGEIATRFPAVEIIGEPSYIVAAPEQTIAVSLRELPVRLAGQTRDMSQISQDPRFAALLEATARVTAPGMPFEIVEEDVLGQQLPVFANRAHSMREILVGAERFGHRDCYVFGDGFRLAFDELVPHVASLAVALRDEHGIGAGDRVAVCAANCREWIMTFWAVAALDAVLVAMNGWWTGAEMRNALELTDPKLLIMDEKRRARLDVDPDVPVLLTEHDFAGLFDNPAAELPEVPIAEDDPFILIFTSGTTGRPKAAVLSHRSVISYLMEQSFIGGRGMAMAGVPSGAAVAPPSDSPNAPPPTVRLAPYPLFHVSGMSMAVSTVMSGSPTVWPLGRFDPANVLRLTREEGISVWGGGTTHIVRLLQHPDIETIDASKVSSIGIGGSATPPDVVRQIEERFPHLESSVSSGYGSTETGLISWAPGWMLKAAPDCVGPLMPTSQARITDDDGTELPPGAEGNIEARSWMSMLGYWHNDDANAETVRPGRWIRTGDFGRFEDDILFIASRKRDLIIRGGENIYPFEIEHRLDEHDEVVEAAVYGVDDPTFGQVVKAVVVVAPGSPLTADEVRAFCALTLASYKVPEQVDIRTEPLPRTANGKVMKQVLAGQAENTFIEE